METTKDELIAKLNAYTETRDDDVIRFKEKIKKTLLSCPELLLALNRPDLEDQLFNEDGTLNEEGEWDAYFGKAILPYMMFPDTLTEASTFLCYMVHFDEGPRYNDQKLYNYQVSFVILSHYGDVLDQNTGLARTDLIGSIIREQFNWSNIFGTQCVLSSNTERTTETKFVMRTLVFEGTSTNGMTNTFGGRTQVINHQFRTVM